MSKSPDHKLHNVDYKELLPKRTPEKQREIEKMYANFGETLGWKNITTDQNKIADAEILLVTGGDLEFLLMHHRVRDLLEANAVWNGVLFKGYAEPEDIYKRLEEKAPMPVELSDGSGQKVDLRDMARLLRIEEKNRYLGNKKIPTDELRRRFFAKGDLKVEEIIVDGKPLDLNTLCKKDDLADFDFEKYIDKIEENQIGFQYLGELRDEVLVKHHIENASHTLFIPTGKIRYNGKPEYRFMPVSGTIAARDARADLQKQDAAFKAAGHVHEFGNYCETNGTTVKIDPQLLKQHREQVSLRQIERTLPRTFRAAVGLEREEEMTIISDSEVKGHEDKGKMNIAVIGGNNRKGKIYKGLHDTYDKAMQETRGYGLTDQEADDLIFTDIIAPFIYANPTDWLMCFAKSASALGYKAEKAVVQGGDQWDQYGGKDKEGNQRGGQKFCVAIPSKDGLKYFFNYGELINYVNERIGAGDIEGIKSDVRVTYAGMTQAQADQESQDKTEDEIAAEQGEIESMLPKPQKSFVALMKKIFKKDVETVLQNFADNGADAAIVVNGKTEIFSKYLKDQLRSQDFKEITEIVGIADKNIKEKEFFILLKRLTPAMRVDILQLAKTGKEQPGRPESEISIDIVKLINQEDIYTETGTLTGLAEFQKALGDCAEFIKQFDPDAIEEKTDASGLKELKLVDPHKKGWAQVLHKMKIIMLAHKHNETVRSAIGGNINDPKWLLRQSIILSGKSKSLEGLNL